MAHQLNFAVPVNDGSLNPWRDKLERSLWGAQNPLLDGALHKNSLSNEFQVGEDPTRADEPICSGPSLK